MIWSRSTREHLRLLGRLARRTGDLRSNIRAHVLNCLWEFSESAHPDSVKVRCLELIGKSEGMYVDVKQTTVTHDIPQLRQLSLDELLALRETMMKALPEPVEAEVRVDS